jgi:hypothetical protein
LLNNSVEDIHVNRTVISKTNKVVGELETKMYKEDLFIESDFTLKPKHIQFCYALLREARISDEKCQVSPNVRAALDDVYKVNGLMEVMTNPGTSMSTRIELEDKYIWPKVQELLGKDVEDKKKEGSQTEQGDGMSDPNKIFDKEYSEAEKKFPEAVTVKEIEKALKERKEHRQNKTDNVNEEYARKLGVNKEDLQNYRITVDYLNKIVNPETGVRLMEELRNLFIRIISKRLNSVQTPKYPINEGDELIDPAQLVADVKAGNLQPKVWMDTEIKEKKNNQFGEVEVTLVCDRSLSMDEGQKGIEQQRSATLIMEAMKEFAELCESEKTKIDKSLIVKSEVYSFRDDKQEDKIPLKKMSAELGEAERVGIFGQLSDLSGGSTTDYNCLEAIKKNLDSESKKKIKNGELKKIVIILTDGESSNKDKVQNYLREIREDGVISIGVGITEEGEPVLSTYAPNALVVENVEKLPSVLGDLLKEHLRDI